MHMSMSVADYVTFDSQAEPNWCMFHGKLVTNFDLGGRKKIKYECHQVMWYLVNNVLWALQEAICLSWCQTHFLAAFYQHAQVTIVTKHCDVDCMHPLICNSYFFNCIKKIDTQNLWSIKPVKYGPHIFPWQPLIDRVVMYLRSGMTACLCWHTDSQTVWCTCWSYFVVTQEGDDNGWPSVERDCLLWWCACTTNEPSDLLLWQGNGAWKPLQTNPICNFIIREKLFAYLEGEIVHFTPSCSCTTLVMTQL